MTLNVNLLLVSVMYTVTKRLGLEARGSSEVALYLS